MDIKLGDLATEAGIKDAIHVPVVSCYAGENLQPGDKVKVISGYARKDEVNFIGMVDPWLNKEVLEYQICWLLLTPGSIQQLRHEWDHPSFPRPEQNNYDYGYDECRGCY